MDIGISSFAAILPDPVTGKVPNAATRIGELIEEIVAADRAGLDVFGVGEHHRPEFADSAPAIILAAAAARTSAIRLTSAISLLSAADPVRLFQDFATLDLVSNGRAEIIVGRGSFGEAFPLYGVRREDHDAALPKSSTCCSSCVRTATSTGPGASVRPYLAKASIRVRFSSAFPFGSASGVPHGPLSAREPVRCRPVTCQRDQAQPRCWVQKARPCHAERRNSVQTPLQEETHGLR